MNYDITFHPSWWHQYAGVDFVQDFFDDPAYRMDCDLKMQRTLYDHFGKYGLGRKQPEKRPILGTDYLAAGYLYSELMGCEIRYQPDNSPQVLCRNLEIEEAAALSAPVLAESEVWARTQRQIDWLQQTFGRVEIHVNLQGIQNVAMDLLGEELLIAYYTEPELAQKVLQTVTDLTIDVGRRFRMLSDELSGGVTAIIRRDAPKAYLTSNCTVEMISNEMYEQFLLPMDQQLAETFSPFAIHHCGKSMEHVVRGYSKVPHLQFAEVGAFSDVKAVRRALPGVFLNARYSPVRLMQASREEIFSEVEALHRDGAENGGRISVSCVGIDSKMPEQQLLHFLDACEAVSQKYASAAI